MMQKIKGFFCLLLISSLFLCLIMGCGQGEESAKSKGLKQTPTMLYKSFRKTTPKAYGGKAPELAKDVDLSPNFPTPGDQGMIGSCTAWATAYACKSFQENIEHEWGVESNEHLFSPSFIYNQINRGVDGGSAIEEAVALVMEKGCASFSTMPYTQDYQAQPDTKAFNEARNYKAKSFARVDSKNPEAVKEVLNRGQPVLIGMLLYENYDTYAGGIYDTTEGMMIGGHAMCVVGYDEEKEAFKIINSWSTYWGEGGYAWVSYDIFARDVMTALVMYDEVVYQPEEAAAPVEVESSQGAFPDRIEVTWAKAKNAQSYRIYRSLKQNEDFKEVAQTKGTKYIDTKDIKPGQIYYYAVKSVGRAGESDFSETSKGFAGSLEKEIAVPQNVQGLFSEQAVYLKWENIRNIDGFYVYRFNHEKENYIRLGKTKDTSYRDQKDFVNGEELWYIVTAYKGEKKSAPSEALSVVITIEEKPELKELKKPRNVKASAGEYEDKIVVSWQGVEGATAYAVYRWQQGDETWSLLAETGELTYEDKALAQIVEYYVIVAKNEYVESEPSDMATGFTREHEEEQVEYDDEEYYDDTEFEDTDYTDEDLYDDDEYTEDEEIIYDDFEEEEEAIVAEEEKVDDTAGGFFDSKEEQEQFFDSKEEQEEFFDSKEEQEEFFDSKEEQEEFFDSEEEQKEFFDSEEEQEEFFDSDEEEDDFFGDGDEDDFFGSGGDDFFD